MKQFRSIQRQIRRGHLRVKKQTNPYMPTVLERRTKQGKWVTY